MMWFVYGLSGLPVSSFACFLWIVFAVYMLLKLTTSFGRRILALLLSIQPLLWILVVRRLGSIVELQNELCVSRLNAALETETTAMFVLDSKLTLVTEKLQLIYDIDESSLVHNELIKSKHRELQLDKVVLEDEIRAVLRRKGSLQEILAGLRMAEEARVLRLPILSYLWSNFKRALGLRMIIAPEVASIALQTDLQNVTDFRSLWASLRVDWSAMVPWSDCSECAGEFVKLFMPQNNTIHESRIHVRCSLVEPLLLLALLRLIVLRVNWFPAQEVSKRTRRRVWLSFQSELEDCNRRFWISVKAVLRLFVPNIPTVLSTKIDTGTVPATSVPWRSFVYSGCLLMLSIEVPNSGSSCAIGHRCALPVLFNISAAFWGHAFLLSLSIHYCARSRQELYRWIFSSKVDALTAFNRQYISSLMVSETSKLYLTNLSDYALREIVLLVQECKFSKEVNSQSFVEELKRVIASRATLMFELSHSDVLDHAIGKQSRVLTDSVAFSSAHGRLRAGKPSSVSSCSQFIKS